MGPAKETKIKERKEQSSNPRTNPTTKTQPESQERRQPLAPSPPHGGGEEGP